MDIEVNNIYNLDCLEGMKYIKDCSIDMILCDLPYGTTQNKWDSTLPLDDYIIHNNKLMNEEEWLMSCFKNNMKYDESIQIFNSIKHIGLINQYSRIIKDNGAIVLFAQTPFDKVLGYKFIKQLKYEWIWEKTAATGHLNAKKMPMKAHENILVFYKKLPTYNPQMIENCSPTHSYTKHQDDGSNYGKTKVGISGGGSTTRYPRSIQVFKTDKQTCSLHPTQKPVALCEYLINTYTTEGEIVLDNCIGSGTTAVAAINTGRKYIGFEKDNTYCEIAKNRIAETIDSQCVKSI